jgi:hypothetical protein
MLKDMLYFIVNGDTDNANDLTRWDPVIETTTSAETKLPAFAVVTATVDSITNGDFWDGSLGVVKTSDGKTWGGALHFSDDGINWGEGQYFILRGGNEWDQYFTLVGHGDDPRSGGQSFSCYYSRGYKEPHTYYDLKTLYRSVITFSGSATFVNYPSRKSVPEMNRLAIHLRDGAGGMLQ